MKPRKGKTMSKAGGYVCICNRNMRGAGLQRMSHPGLRWQDWWSGGQTEQVKSIMCCQTEQGKQPPKGCGELSVADQFVVARKSLKGDGAKGLTCLVEIIIDNWQQDD